MAIARKTHCFSELVANKVNLYAILLVWRIICVCCSPGIPILRSIVVSTGAEEQRRNYW
jgi:hypothetical protein